MVFTKCVSKIPSKVRCIPYKNLLLIIRAIFGHLVTTKRGHCLKKGKGSTKWSFQVVMCREKAAQSGCQNCHLNSIFMPHLASCLTMLLFQKKIRETGYFPYSFSQSCSAQNAFASSENKMQKNYSQDSLEKILSKPLKRFLL